MTAKKSRKSVAKPLATKQPQDDAGNPIGMPKVSQRQMSAIFKGLRSCSSKDVPELVTQHYNVPDEPQAILIRGVHRSTMQRYMFMHSLFGTAGFVRGYGKEFFRDVIQPTIRYYGQHVDETAHLLSDINRIFRQGVVPLFENKIRRALKELKGRYAYGSPHRA